MKSVLFKAFIYKPQTPGKDVGSDLIEYPQHLHLPSEYIQAKISEFLIEDMPDGDVTTDSIIPETALVTAEIQAVENLTFVGAEIVPYCFGSSCSIRMYKTDGEIAEIVTGMPCFNLKPASIISRLKLKSPIYSETAAYGHMGRESESKKLSFISNGEKQVIDVETFTWEKLDCREEIKSAFGL